MGVDITDLKLLPLLVILLLPLLWCWVPYTLLAFGIQGPWCGIRIHTEDCKFFFGWKLDAIWSLGDSIICDVFPRFSGDDYCCNG